MSSLSATQSDGYYVPAKYFDNDPRVLKKSKNAIARQEQEQQQQRQSAAVMTAPGGHNQFSKYNVCRFEMPYKGRCDGCGATISKGTRYNAYKEKTLERYYTTPIYQFTCTCRSCGIQQFIIRTNPKERSFDYISGISKRRDHDVASNIDAAITAAAAAVASSSQLHHTNTNDDALRRLETLAAGERRVLTERDQLELLMKRSQVQYQDDSKQNAKLRQIARVERQSKKRRLKDGSKLGWRSGMELLSSSSSNSNHHTNSGQEDDKWIDDHVQAKSVVFESKEMRKDPWKTVRQSSIFDSKKAKKKKRRKHQRIRDTSSVQQQQQQQQNDDVIRPDRVVSSRSSTTSATVVDRHAPQESQTTESSSSFIASTSNWKDDNNNRTHTRTTTTTVRHPAAIVRIRPRTQTKAITTNRSPVIVVTSALDVLDGYGSSSSSEEERAKTCG